MSDRKEFEDWFFSPSNSMSMSDIDVAWDAWQASAQRTQAEVTDEQREYFLEGYESAQRDAIACRIPPTGFTFVAVRIDDEALVKRGMDRLREAHHDITAQTKKETP